MRGQTPDEHDPLTIPQTKHEPESQQEYKPNENLRTIQVSSRTSRRLVSENERLL